MRPSQSLSPIITPTNPSILVLNTNRAPLTSSLIDSKSGYAYFADAEGPARIFKIHLSDFTNTANLTLAQGENYAESATIDPTNGVGYFGTYTGQIVKVDLATLTEEARMNTTSGEIMSAAIDPTNGFAYFGTSTGSIIRVRTSDFSLNKTLSLASAGVGAAAVDPASGYGYFGAAGCGINVFHPPPRTQIVKIRLSDFTIATRLDPDGTCPASAVIDHAAGYVYFDSNAIGVGYVVRYSLSDFSPSGALAPQFGSASSFALDPVRGLGYIVGGPFISTFRLADLNEINASYIQNPQYHLIAENNIVVDSNTGYAYFAGQVLVEPFSQTGVIVRVSPARTPSNDFSLEASPSHVTFQNGGVGAGLVTISSNGLSGSVALSATLSSAYALKPSAEILQPTLTLTENGENSTTLELSAPIQDALSASTFIVTITGESGSISRSISIQVTITSGPGFLSVVNPASLSLKPGGSYSPNIWVQTDSGFSGTLNFTSKVLPDIPHGPSVGVSPSSVAFSLPPGTGTGVSWVNVSTNSTTAPGQYEVDVTATTGNQTLTSQLCLLILPQGTTRFCILSNPNKLILGPGQTETSLITQYTPLPLFNITNTWLNTVNMTATILTGPSTTGLVATIRPGTFTVPHIIPGPQEHESTLTVTALSNAQPGQYMIRAYSTNGTVTGYADIPVTITATPVTAIPGLFPGDRAQYKVSATWTATPAGLPPIPEISNYLNSYAATLRIGATIANETAGVLATSYLNGTQNVQEITGNTLQESGTLFPWMIGTNLSFNITTSQPFVGSNRQVTILGITRTVSGVTVTGTWTWDLQTGILLDYQLTIQGTGSAGTINGQIHITIIDTNLWTPTLPAFAIKPRDQFPTLEPNTTNYEPLALTSLYSFTGNVALTLQSLPETPSLTLLINNSISLGPNQTSNATLKVTSAYPGRYIILVTATSGPETHYAVLRLTVKARAPAITIMSLSPNPANTGDLITIAFTANTASPLTQLSVDWGDGTNLPLDPTATTATHTYQNTMHQSSIQYQITITAVSTAGSSHVTTREVVKDRAPTVTIAISAPGELKTRQTVTLSFSATDPDGTIKSVSVQWGDRTIVNFDSNAASISQQYQRAGTYTINVTAIDDSGSTGTQAMTITVGDLPPTLTITGTTANHNGAQTYVYLSLSASDPDGTVTSITINWGDGTTATIVGTATSTDHTYTTTGSYTISATATDNSGSTSQTLTQTLTINQPQSRVTTQPTIPGITAVIVYGMIGAAFAAAIAAIALVLVMRKKLSSQT